MDRRILITCLVLLLIACLVGAVVLVGGGLLFFRVSDVETSLPALEDAPVTIVIETPTPRPSDPNTGPETGPETGAQDAIDPEIARQMDLIQLEVIQERGLEPNGSFTRAIYDRPQVRQRVLDDFLAEYTPEEASQDVIVLSAFDLLRPGFDLHTLYIDLLSEQVAGFYDDETQEMVIVQEEDFDGLARLVYAHEYTHALQDQNFDIDEGLNYNEEACETDSERCAAIQALLEGDASLSETNWFLEHASSQDYEDILSFYETFESPILDSAPEFLSRDFIFPYEQGLVFVQHLYDNGGWGSVNRAYSTPPVSTEQILHPEKYPVDKPVLVELPDLSTVLGPGWEELDRNVMGEWYTFLVLAYSQDENARLDESVASQAAAGWGGDAYIVYHQAENNQTVMVLHTVWDQAAEAQEFVQAFQSYANARFGQPENNSAGQLAWQGSDGYHSLYFDELATTWILASDQEMAAKIWSEIQP